VPAKRPDSNASARTIDPAPARDVLRFSPTAWAKLLYFRDRGGTEIGGFGITASKDLLRIEEFVTIRQKTSVATVSFDDDAVADFFEAQIDAGRRPEQFARVWCHTHPGDSPQPSMVDVETFERVFGRCEWAVMCVLARGGKSYARLRFNIGPGGETLIPVEVDWRQAFGPSDHKAWEEEYKANILPASWSQTWGLEQASFGAQEGRGVDPDDWLSAFEAMNPEDRCLVVEELAARPELWDEEGEVGP